MSLMKKAKTLVATMELTKHSVTFETVPVEDFDEAAYLVAADRAGYSAGQLVVTEIRAKEKMASTIQGFRRFLAENGITVYEDNAVRKYMTSIVPRGKQWRWIGIRPNPGSSYAPVRYLTQGQYEKDTSYPYTKPIPLAVLMVMGKIRDAYPNVSFQVTDIRDVPKPDPFLAVSLDGEEWFIIERWDEPGFRT